MPTLVAPLVNGFPDAPNGRVEFYQTGTATLSSLVYSDANGIIAVTTHTLDANGRIVRYVNEVVDVLVRTSAGVVIAGPFTQVVDARSVRVENTMFTGPNTNGNGQVVAGGRTTLHAGLSLLRASLGVDDGLVRWDDDTEYSIQTAVRMSIRQGRSITTTVAGTTYTPNAYYELNNIAHSSGATMAIANPSPDWNIPGATLTIVYANSTGGNRTPTWGTAYSNPPATAVATATRAVYMFKQDYNFEWVAVTTSPTTDAA